MNDTASFFLDGSPKEMGFFARENPGRMDWPKFDKELIVEPVLSDETEVIITRGCLFFCAAQKITLGKLREFFTAKAIKLLEKDDYIKIITKL